MPRTVLLIALIYLFTAGCSSSTDRTAGDGTSNVVTSEQSRGPRQQRDTTTGNAGPQSTSLDGGSPSSLIESNPTPVAIRNGSVALSPENTTIQFVGKHTDQRPDRVGVFEKFQGTIEVDPITHTIKLIAIEIDAASLVTNKDKLTNHLKSADFFEVDEFPIATFQSTDVSATDAEAHYQVSGTLVLHGVEKDVSFPASVNLREAGLTLQSEFVLHRSEFDMNYGPDQIKDDVSMTVVIGAKTQRPQTPGTEG